MKKEKTSPQYGMWKCTKFMLTVAWKESKLFVFCQILFAFMTVAVGLLELFISPTILNQLETKASLETLLFTIIAFTLGLVLLNGSKVYIHTAMSSTRIGIRSSVIHLILRKQSTMSYPYTEDKEIQQKVNKTRQLVGGNHSVTEQIFPRLSSILFSMLLFLIYIGMLSNIHSILIVVISITCIISYLIAKRINQWGYRHREEERSYYQKLYYAQDVSEDLSLAKDIRLFGMKQWVDDMFYASTHLFHQFRIRGEREYIKMDFIDLLFSFLRNGIAYFYLINLVLGGELSTAEFLLYFSVVSAFSSKLTHILELFQQLYKDSIELSSLLEFLNQKELFLFEEGTPLEIQEKFPYELRLKNVSFRYPEANQDTLSNINLCLKHGEKLAIVGLNGAGKTTLVKLLCGLYDPSQGEVLLNGRNIKEYNRKDYYKLFSAVFQEYSALPISLAENISQKKDSFDLDRITDCIEKAGLHQKLASLEEGHLSHIGREIYEDGIELSGGELQRLILARALYKDAPFIILDEPTAALDPLAESDLYHKYHNMTVAKSSIYISHRLASTRFCDRILLLDKGSISEEGSHEELLTLGGKYHELYEIQSKYYREGEMF